MEVMRRGMEVMGREGRRGRDDGKGRKERKG